MDDTVGLNIKSQMTLIINQCETVTEKVEQLTKLKEKTIQEIDNVINNISSGYAYCEKCRKWYKNRAWSVRVTKEPRKVLSCTTFCTGEEPDMVYAEKNVVVRKLECPVGHLQPYRALDVE